MWCTARWRTLDYGRIVSSGLLHSWPGKGGNLPWLQRLAFPFKRKESGKYTLLCAHQSLSLPTSYSRGSVHTGACQSLPRTPEALCPREPASPYLIPRRQEELCIRARLPRSSVWSQSSCLHVWPIRPLDLSLTQSFCQPVCRGEIASGNHSVPGPCGSSRLNTSLHWLQQHLLF